MDISSKAGQAFNVTHNLNSVDVLVDIVGRAQASGAVHQRIGIYSSYLPGWNMTYGGTNSEYRYGLVRTSDGFAIPGYTNSFGAGGDDVFLVKTDASGNMQWNKTFGGTGTDQGYAVVRAGDGGYAVAGYTNSYSTSYDMFLAKTDVQGDFGLGRTDTTANTITLYRGTNDVYWNYIRVRIWKIK